MSDYFVTILAERLTRVLHNKKRTQSLFVYSGVTEEDMALFADSLGVDIAEVIDLYRQVQTPEGDIVHVVLYNTISGEDKISICAGVAEMEKVYREHLQRNATLAIAERRRRRRYH